MSMARYIFTVSAYKDTRIYRTADTGVRTTKSRELMLRSEPAIKNFLGTIRITSKAAIFPTYYGELLAWALKRYMEREHWQTAGILGYHYSEPLYANVSTDYHEIERVLVSGQLLINSGNHRLAVTVDARGCARSQLRVVGSAVNKLEVKKFVDGIKAVAWKENYYRNKKLEFDGGIRFVNISDESWGNICLQPATKAQIKASTIDSLSQGQPWTRKGLPLKRCVLIEGEAVESEAAICKALMAEASGITCITTDVSELDYDCITELYHLARDLSPCIVFIMNIDRLDQKRINSDYQQGAPLISLLTILGSIEEYEKIVTVATASNVNSLGTAMLC
jgi:cell division protease FtsH